jgi:amino acid transporter
VAWLNDHKVLICLILIAFIAVANLRGVRESGALFAAPTYSFVISFLFMVGYGIVHYFIHPAAAPAPEDLKLAEGYHLQPLTWFLLLGAFSNGLRRVDGN